jgi:hypothetical protein
VNRRRLVYPLLVLAAAAIVWLLGLGERRRPERREPPASPTTGSGASTIAPAPRPAPAPDGGAAPR